MSKFKIGDTVRIIADYSPSQNKKVHIGKCFTIARYYDPIKSFYGKDSYEFDETHYAWFDDELELVKPKFNYKNYPGKYVMHVTTEEQADIFCKYLHSVGKTWFTGCSYLSNINFNKYGEKTCYDFDNGEFSSNWWYKSESYTILEFEDFDWSDFNMKKEFTKKDLKNGDVIKYRNGDTGVVCIETGTVIMDENEYMLVNNICDDLTHLNEYGIKNKEWDVVAVRRPNTPADCRPCAFKHKCGTLIYERVEEMTLEEVCKALGKEIKIVKEK